MVPKLAPRTVARGASALAGLFGAFGFLTLMGAFGPMSCWTSESSSSSATDGGGSVATHTVTHGCEAGIAYLWGSTDGNAPVLFFWAFVLLALVVVGGLAVWTGHRYVTAATGVVGAVVSVLGLFSIGWLFFFPTLCLLVAAAALTADTRGDDGNRPSVT